MTKVILGLALTIAFDLNDPPPHVSRIECEVYLREMRPAACPHDPGRTCLTIVTRKADCAPSLPGAFVVTEDGEMVIYCIRACNDAGCSECARVGP